VCKLNGSRWFPLAFMIFCCAFRLLIPFTFQGMQTFQDLVLNAYLWLLLGILFRLSKLAQAGHLAQGGQAASSGVLPSSPSGNR
jgi:hypothetical protein